MPRAKKEDIFYTLLKDFAARIDDAAEEYVRIITSYPDTTSEIPQMKVFENKCDEKVKHIMEELYSSFVTPIERSDINDLALAMDDIVEDYKKDPLVMEKAIAVGHIEDEGDLVYQNALRRLFQEEPNGRYTVTWTRLFDQMENLLDACDNTAGVVRSVVLKGA